MFKRAFYSMLTLLLASPALAKVEAIDGYVRLLPPGAPNTAAFMVLKNDGDKPVTLTTVSSPGAARAELHTHLHENGVMRMRQVDGIQIPARGEVALKPGSFHVMLFEVRELAQATPFPLTLTLDDGQTLSLSLPVKPVEPMKGMQH